MISLKFCDDLHTYTVTKRLCSNLTLYLQGGKVSTVFALVFVTLEQVFEGLDGDLNRQVDVVAQVPVDVFGQAAYFHTRPWLLCAAAKRAPISLAPLGFIGARGETAEEVLQEIIGGSTEIGQDVASEPGNLILPRVNPKNFSCSLNPWHAGDCPGSGPGVARYPSPVQVVPDGLFHDDVHVAVFGEHDEGLGQGVFDGLHQAVQPEAGLRGVLGEVVGQNVQEFHAGVAIFRQEGYDLFTA